MPERMGHTEPFQSGQNTLARDKGEKVPVKFKMSKVRNVGSPDPLAQALTAPPREAIKDTMHFAKRSVRPGGADYKPEGEFGRPRAGSAFRSKASGLESHSSRPGQNALGNHSGGRGGNPLGNPSGGRGGYGNFRGRG